MGVYDKRRLRTMKLRFLGRGSAFTVGGNFHSNMLLEADTGRRLLLDCGTDARHALKNLGLTYHDINDVYISHLHADHAGGLEWLGFTHKFDPSCKLPKLYLTEMLVDDLWEKSLAGSMSSIQEYPAELSTYFDVHVIPISLNAFTWEGITFNLIQSTHVWNYDKLVPCFGLLYDVNGKTIYWTADTQFTPERHLAHYQRADLIFHDCETSPCHSGVHAHYDQLLTMPADIRAKMWLYHYNPGELPDAKSAGFRGFVELGQEFDFLLPETFE